VVAELDLCAGAVRADVPGVDEGAVPEARARQAEDDVVVEASRRVGGGARAGGDREEDDGETEETGSRHVAREKAVPSG
jgi:hypothetical protein